MKKQALIEYINKHDDGTTNNGFEFKLKVEHFDCDVDVLVDNIPSVHSEPAISILTAIIADLQTFNPETTDWFKEQIWNHFKTNMERASYGSINYEGFESEMAAKFAHFGVSSKEDAYKTLRLGCVLIYVYKEGIRNFDLAFSCPWDMEHGLTVGVSNHQFSHIE